MHVCVHVYVGCARFSVCTITVCNRVSVCVCVSVLWLPHASGCPDGHKGTISSRRSPSSSPCLLLGEAPTDELRPAFVPLFVSYTHAHPNDLLLTPEESPRSAQGADEADIRTPSLQPS